MFDYDSFKYVSLWIDPELSFKPCIDYIINRTCCLGLIYRLMNCLTFQVMKIIVSQLILPVLFIRIPLAFVLSLLMLFIFICADLCQGVHSVLIIIIN